MYSSYPSPKRFYPHRRRVHQQATSAEAPNHAPAAQRLCEHKYGTRALSDIFAVVFFTMVILTHRNWLQIFIQKLKRLFIHADHGAFLIEGTRIYLKDVFHMRYEFGVLFWRNTPVTFAFTGGVVRFFRVKYAAISWFSRYSSRILYTA